MREDKEIKGSKNNEALEKELKERLDWYAMHASDEEYDGKAVEYILYLLDSLEPLGDDVVPSADEAWERFQGIADGQELLPLDGDVALPPVSEVPGKKERKVGKLGRFVARHKLVAAAVLLVMVLAVGGTIQAGAKKDGGFFFWLNRDDSGTQMVTSPEDLDVKTNKTGYACYDRGDVPEWAQEWLKIEEKFEMQENYQWQYFEISIFENMQGIISHYLDMDAEKEILLGMRMYLDKVSYNRDKFTDYDYVDSYEVSQNRMDVYSKMEETEKIYYAISFYQDNYQYFVEGQDDLDKLKSIMNQYWDYVNNK